MNWGRLSLSTNSYLFSPFLFSKRCNLIYFWNIYLLPNKLSHTLTLFDSFLSSLSIFQKNIACLISLCFSTIFINRDLLKINMHWGARDVKDLEGCVLCLKSCQKSEMLILSLQLLRFHINLEHAFWIMNHQEYWFFLVT